MTANTKRHSTGHRKLLLLPLLVLVVMALHDALDVKLETARVLGLHEVGGA